MNQEEMDKELEKAGINTGTWNEAGGIEGQPAFVKTQLDLLLQLRAALEGQVQNDQAELVKARQTLARISHGGGI